VSDTSKDPHYVGWKGLPKTQSELAVPVKSGERLLGVLDIQSTEKDAFDASDLEAMNVLADQLAVALDNALLFEETNHRAKELEAISQVSAAMRVASSGADILKVTLEQVTRLFSAQAAAILIRGSPNGNIHVEQGCGNWASLTGKGLPSEWAAWEYVIASAQPYVNNGVQNIPNLTSAETAQGIQAMACVPLISHERAFGALAIGCDQSISTGEQRMLAGIADMIANAIQRSSLYEQTQRDAAQMAAVSAIGRTLAETLDLQETYARLAQAIQDFYPDATTVLIANFDAHHELITCAYGILEGQRIDVSTLPPIPLAPPGEGTQSLVIRTRQPLIMDDLPGKLKGRHELSSVRQSSQSAIYAPLLAKGEVLGLLKVQCPTPGRFSKADAELLTLVANTGAIAIENARLFGETKQRVQRLGALRAMDMAISSSFDLRVTLNVLLDQVTAQLNVDAACVLLYNAHTRTLEYAAGRGFQSGTNGATSLRIDQSLAGLAALERRMVHFPNLRANKGTRPLLQPVEDDSFVAYYAIPLIAKAQVKGVLEIYNRSPLSPDPEWMEFLEALAGDTAIAIDNTALFNELQRSNVELILAYDRTLEGWSRALELRDEETEGHSQRVTEKTVQLARAMGMSEAELVHVRRGALLHDIGKMGIPDRILHKPGPLVEEEWKIMRRHPVDAFDMLSPIPYLKQALDIPYNHHERWDGSGYPNGLKGEQIPLAARIFAVVDVWDALLSERPYRAAWPEVDVIAYLRQEAGKQFDPQVVEAFLRLRTQN
jgi:putative nucleotidyltransferase with HDIG domain